MLRRHCTKVAGWKDETLPEIWVRWKRDFPLVTVALDPAEPISGFRHNISRASLEHSNHLRSIRASRRFAESMGRRAVEPDREPVV